MCLFTTGRCTRSFFRVATWTPDSEEIFLTCLNFSTVLWLVISLFREKKKSCVNSDSGLVVNVTANQMKVTLNDPLYPVKEHFYPCKLCLSGWRQSAMCVMCFGLDRHQIWAYFGVLYPLSKHRGRMFWKDCVRPSAGFLQPPKEHVKSYFGGTQWSRTRPRHTMFFIGVICHQTVKRKLKVIAY